MKRDEWFDLSELTDVARVEAALVAPNSEIKLRWKLTGAVIERPSFRIPLEQRRST